MTETACLIYGLNSAEQAACALPHGVAGYLALPADTDCLDALRGAHLLAPVDVRLTGLDYDAAHGVFVCQTLALL